MYGCRKVLRMIIDFKALVKLEQKLPGGSFKSAFAAILGGKLAAEVIVDKALDRPTKQLKEIRPEIVAAAEHAEPRSPVGVRGEFPIAFGGGQQSIGAEPNHP